MSFKEDWGEQTITSILDQQLQLHNLIYFFILGIYPLYNERFEQFYLNILLVTKLSDIL